MNTHNINIELPPLPRPQVPRIDQARRAEEDVE